MPRATPKQQATAPIAPVHIQKPTAKKPVRRTVAPVSIRKEREVAGQAGQDKPRVMKTLGDARESLEGAEIEPVTDGPATYALVEELAFLEEKVTVIVHDQQDVNNPRPVVELWCNGRSQYLTRNVEHTIARKFVERLARSRTTRYRQERYQDANGFDAIRNVPMTSVDYPFSVLHDPSPRGRAWLSKILSEA